MVAFLELIIGKFRKYFRHPSKKSIFTQDLIKGENFQIGEFTYGCPIIHMWDNKTKLYIGKFCSISTDVHILLGGNHRTDWITTYPFNILSQNFPSANNITGHPSTKGDIKIGNDVWVGYGSTILSGITIGDGAVIAANAVVTKDVPPYTIVAGNPARVVKKRFDDVIIEKLLQIKWWDWPIEKINTYTTLLCSNDFDKILDIKQDKTL